MCKKSVRKLEHNVNSGMCKISLLLLLKIIIQWIADQLSLFESIVNHLRALTYFPIADGQLICNINSLALQTCNGNSNATEVIYK